MTRTGLNVVLGGSEGRARREESNAIFAMPVGNFAHPRCATKCFLWQGGARELGKKDPRKENESTILVSVNIYAILTYGDRWSLYYSASAFCKHNTKTWLGLLKQDSFISPSSLENK